MFVGSALGVVASLVASNGNIDWRQVLPSASMGSIRTMALSPDRLGTQIIELSQSITLPN